MGMFSRRHTEPSIPDAPNNYKGTGMTRAEFEAFAQSVQDDLRPKVAHLKGKPLSPTDLASFVLGSGGQAVEDALAKHDPRRRS